jgi:hypothetical protein
VEGLSTSVALVVVGAAALAGALAVAAALVVQAGAVKRLASLVDDVRSILQMMQDNQAASDARRQERETRALEIEERDREPGVEVRMRGTLTLMEESQEFKAGFFVVAIGSRRVLVDRIRAVLVNDRDPELTVTLEAIHNVVLEPGVPREGDLTISVRDLARINLPFVPEFRFMRESCRLLLSAEYVTAGGKKAEVERDILSR